MWNRVLKSGWFGVVLDTLIWKTIELPRSGLNKCDSKKSFSILSGGFRGWTKTQHNIRV